MSMPLENFFFFFQAEDGIRDVAVTGVQTCALPISPHTSLSASQRSRQLEREPGGPESGSRHVMYTIARQRSEEHTSELQSRLHLVCRLLLEKKKAQAELHQRPDRAAVRLEVRPMRH